MLFPSGVILALRFEPEGTLDLALHSAPILLIVGGAVGAYVGSSYIDPEVSEGFEGAKVLAGFNPDLARRTKSGGR